MNGGYTIFQNAVYGSFIWHKPEYLKFWMFLIMQARATENTVYYKDTPQILAAHTVCISVYNTGILELSYKQTRTLLKKLQKAGYIKVYTKAKRTFVLILDSDLYKYPAAKKEPTANKQSRKTPAPVSDNSEFEEYKSKLQQV